MSCADGAAQPRRPGRPRDERVDRSVLAATLDLLAQGGYAALSIEAVAARAEVGKTTIYRRWAGKRELVADALGSLNAAMPELPPPGPVRERALALMVHICDKDPETLSGRILPRMLSYRMSHPELYADYVARVVRPRRERMRQVLRDGIAAGEIRRDIDLDLAAMALTSPLVMLTMTPDPERLPTGAEAGRLLEIVWPGIAAS
jgi:AcrR family transcriptional regulator